jgi:DNA-directed RNA polymerase subunit M/transcription elongation factor TFIIS
MSDIPHCPNCQVELYPKAENDRHWAFVCPRCPFVRIISKPTLQGASRLEVELERRKERMRAEREREMRPRYFIPKIGAA